MAKTRILMASSAKSLKTAPCAGLVKEMTLLAHEPPAKSHIIALNAKDLSCERPIWSDISIKITGWAKCVSYALSAKMFFHKRTPCGDIEKRSMSWARMILSSSEMSETKCCG
jgi:hypothetical protein